MCSLLLNRTYIVFLGSRDFFCAWSRNSWFGIRRQALHGQGKSCAWSEACPVELLLETFLNFLLRCWTSLGNFTKLSWCYAVQLLLKTFLNFLTLCCWIFLGNFTRLSCVHFEGHLEPACGVTCDSDFFGFSLKRNTYHFKNWASWGTPRFVVKMHKTHRKNHMNTNFRKRTGRTQIWNTILIWTFKKHCKYHDLLLPVKRRRKNKQENHSRGKPSGGLFLIEKAQDFKFWHVLLQCSICFMLEHPGK